jgi:hypothetical protein
MGWRAMLEAIRPNSASNTKYKLNFGARNIERNAKTYRKESLQEL